MTSVVGGNQRRSEGEVCREEENTSSRLQKTWIRGNQIRSGLLVDVEYSSKMYSVLGGQDVGWRKDYRPSVSIFGPANGGLLTADKVNFWAGNKNND